MTGHRDGGMTMKFAYKVVSLFLLTASIATKNTYAWNEQLLNGNELLNYINQVVAGSLDAIKELPPQQQQQVLATMERENIYPELDVNLVNMQTSSLPLCAPGYWGANWAKEDIEERSTTSGLKYQVGPNCYRFQPGDCGSDSDDAMVSFYLGNHAESLAELRPLLKWTSSSDYVRLYMALTHLGKFRSRVYEQTKDGQRDNYNVYICLPGYLFLYMDTIVIRKY